MKHTRLLYLFPLLFFGITHTEGRDTIEHPSGLLIAAGTAISQSDFDSGSYRITDPGYYYLTEDIVFEPNQVDEAGRSDKPDVGWFTAVSIECDNVIFDLNTKTLECSQDFVDTQSFKVFSMIELNNSPFPHFLFGFVGESEFKKAHNVLIKNGTLGRCSHHGIHGNDNNSIRVHNMIIRDWEVSAISFNGLKNAEIKHCLISGIEHKVPFTGLMAVIQMALIELQKLVDNSDPNAQDYIDNLTPFANDPNKNGTYPEDSGFNHDGNAYGIFLNRTVDVGPLPTHCDEFTTNCVTIEDVTICNMASKIIETVCIQDNDNNILKGQRFGVMRWADAYPEGTFAPNELLKAQAYAADTNDSGQLPAGFAANILSETPNEATFLSQVKPGFISDFAGHTNKGVFGIRVDCGHGVHINNCRVMNIENIGELGNVLADLPGGSNYDFDQIRYTGNDVYGISLVGCHNCTVENSSVFECASANGNVQGISIINNSHANDIINCISNDHRTSHDDVDSVVNPSGRTFGYIVNSASNANEFTNCQAQLLASERYAIGFNIESSYANKFNNCSALNNEALAGSDFNSEKLAVGFRSTKSECTVCNECTASYQKCTNEDPQESQSQSIAAGFIVDGTTEANDNYASIENSTAESNDGGAGTGVGIMAKEAGYITIKANKLAHNRTANSVGDGFGLYTVQGDSCLVSQNLAYGNSTTNFNVMYTEANINKQLPIRFSNYYNLDDLDYLAKGLNMSIAD